MSVQHDIVTVLQRHGYMLGRLELIERAIGEPGCGQGFRLKLKIVAEKRI